MAAVALNVVRSSGSGGGPLCVLVHGLDSYSGTWQSTMESLSVPCIAIDQQGCGKSEWGEEFSPETLVSDLHEVISKESNGEKVLLVGHSLGGRVAMGYAAKYPQTLCGVVIEDMDIYPRPLSTSPIPIISTTDDDGVVFDRRAPSIDDLKSAFSKFNYPPEIVDGWLTSGRIVQEIDGSYWSNANPDFRRLCYKHLISQPHGRNDCVTIAKQTPKLPFHVMVAGSEGTVCLEESIEEMKTIFGHQLVLHRYPQAGHSIHSSAPTEFCSTLNDIIQEYNINKE